MKKVPLFLTLISLFGAIPSSGQRPIRGEAPQSVEALYRPTVEGIEVELWVDSLTIPWSLAFLPNGDALVAQRPGSILRIPHGTSEPVSYAQIEVVHNVDVGLMGMALHPDFEQAPYVYLMHAYEEQDSIYTRVIRLRHQGESATFDRVVFDRIPGHIIHVGGRIAFGPDKMLYVGTGDLGNPPLSQDLTSLAGKILRLTPEGEIPEDNPFPGSAIYSSGHRVVQGLAWDPDTGDLFNSEHGPSGFPQEGQVRYRDEINRVLPGGNYGWPEVVGAPNLPEYEDPIVVWKMNGAPPSGMTFYRGDLFVATLRSQALVRIQFGDAYEVERIEHWFAKNANEGRYGRLRDAVVGPDGHSTLR